MVFNIKLQSVHINHRKIKLILLSTMLNDAKTIMRHLSTKLVTESYLNKPITEEITAENQQRDHTGRNSVRVMFHLQQATYSQTKEGKELLR